MLKKGYLKIRLSWSSTSLPGKRGLPPFAISEERERDTTWDKFTLYTVESFVTTANINKILKTQEPTGEVQGAIDQSDPAFGKRGKTGPVPSAVKKCERLGLSSDRDL